MATEIVNLNKTQKTEFKIILFNVQHMCPKLEAKVNNYNEKYQKRKNEIVKTIHLNIY